MINSVEIEQIISKTIRVTDNSLSSIDDIICSDRLIVLCHNVDSVEPSDNNLIVCRVGRIKPQSEPSIYNFRSFKNFIDDLVIMIFNNFL